MNAERLKIVYAAGIVLLFLEAGAFGILAMKRLAERDKQAVDWEAARVAHQADMEQREAARLHALEPVFVPATKTKHSCYAINDLVTCHVTNLTKTPIVTCTQGLITQKEAAGVRLYSEPMCTGPIQGLATVVVTSPWSGGRAVDICANGKYLDWDKCNFMNIDYAPN